MPDLEPNGARRRAGTLRRTASKTMTTIGPDERREAAFHPARALRNGHLQSMLASAGFRRRTLQAAASGLRAAARREELRTPGDVRLEAWLAPQPGRGCGTLVLFPGWEGHQDSGYMLALGQSAFDAGWNVARLNFRDHGDTHHLNPGLFHSCRLAEMVEGVSAVAARLPVRPLIVGGCSLGGNFALRVGLHADRPALSPDGVFAVNPVVDARSTLEAMETGLPIYQHYFVRKWSASLKYKGALFPEHYDMSPLRHLRSVRRITQWLIDSGYIDMPSMDEYLVSYSLTSDRLASLRVPARVLLAEDDPIIPFRDFRALVFPESARVEVARHGGHCGFIQDLCMRTWLGSWVAGVLRERLDPELQR